MNLRTSNGRRHASGFTLMELMMVVAILGILVAIALPLYSQHVIKTNRTDGKALLNRISSEQERFFTARGQYTAALATPKPNGLGFVDSMSERGCYQARVALAADAMSYTLFAIPQDNPGCGQQATRDTLCGDLTLTSNGIKDAVGPEGAMCW